MKRILLAMWLAVFAFTGAASAQQQPYGGGLKNLTGEWAVQATGTKLIAGTVHLTQVGNTIIGSAQAGQGHGNGVMQINGTLEGQKVSAKWRGPSGETGWLTLNFNSSGTAFNGSWGYGGRAANGQIVSRKIRTTAF